MSVRNTLHFGGCRTELQIAKFEEKAEEFKLKPAMNELVNDHRTNGTCHDCTLVKSIKGGRERPNEANEGCTQVASPPVAKPITPNGQQQP